MRILVNHIGYELDGIKSAVIESDPRDLSMRCSMKLYSDDGIVARPTPVYAGKADRWKNWHFWSIIFSQVNQSGKYYIECETPDGKFSSSPFLIQRNLLQRQTVSDVVAYFKLQRCVGQFEKADTRMTLEDGRIDVVDVHGGWQDANGDYGKHLSHLSFSFFCAAANSNSRLQSLQELRAVEGGTR